jgi:GntR family transcriptional repressor for pyruvate dehydrogenase complex
MVDAIRKPRLAMQVAASLATSMIERNLAPGDRLPAERELAATFAVSRHVVREALGRLEAQGLVTIDHGRGTVVLARPTPRDLAAFVANLSDSPPPEFKVSLEARSVFEAGLADLIVANATEDAITRLEAIVAALTIAVETRQSVGADDVAFHEQLLRCTNNSLLIKTGQRLVLGYLQSQIYFENGVTSDVYLEAVDLYEHNEIIAAIRRKDVDRLRLLLRYHGYQFDSAERAAAGLPAPKRGAKARE